MKGDSLDTTKLSKWQAYLETGFEPVHNEGNQTLIAAHQLKSSKWRAYEVEYVTTYSHLHGGFCGHLKATVFRDLDGAPYEALDFETLCGLLAQSRALKQSYPVKKGESR